MVPTTILLLGLLAIMVLSGMIRFEPLAETVDKWEERYVPVLFIGICATSFTVIMLVSVEVL